MLLCSTLGDIDTGTQFGKLAIQLVDNDNVKQIKPIVYFPFNNFIRHWKEHLKKSINPFMDTFKESIENGDLNHAGNSIFLYSISMFWQGENLDLVANTQLQSINSLIKYKQEVNLIFAQIWYQCTLDLLEKSFTENYTIIGDSFDEEKSISKMIESKNNTGLAFVYLAKSFVNYLFKDFNNAVKNFNLAEKYQENLSGMIFIAEYNFYYSLAMLANYFYVSKHQQKQYLKKIASHQKQMYKWAIHAPCNFQHKYYLVEAEQARILEQNLKAMALYDRAIAGAKNNGYIQEEALANERAAEFYLALGREQVAKTYMTEAYYAYIHWGAKAKVKILDQKYPQLISRTVVSSTNTINPTLTTSSSTTKESKIFDLTTVIKASLALSGEIVISKLLNNLMEISLENAGAQKGLFIGKQDGQWRIEAEGIIEQNKVEIVQFIANSSQEKFPVLLLNYVERTRKEMVLDDAKNAEIFANDPYILNNQIKSILCLPIIHQGKLTGILYLENNLMTAAFTPERLRVLNLLSSQISISIENARLYTNLQSYSQRLENKSQELEAKSQELEIKNGALQASELREREKAQALEQSLHELQQTQAQLVQTEKISSLGQLVAGVAHEVNNPVSFISGNLHYANQYVEDLLGLVQLYQQHYPEPNPEIAEEIEAIELDYLVEDLPKMLSSMNLGTERIREIMQSLRNFSRVDDAQAKPADIHAGLDSTLMILHHRLKANSVRPAVELIKEYGQLPLVECYPGQLNQVFMNLVANAIDAFDEFNAGKTFAEIERQPNMIRIRTEVNQGGSNGNSTGDTAIIRIADNGLGMSANTLSKLFQPFFTTKPEGKGTGLGLSISYKIVVETHRGSLRCNSTPGEGTEFIIEIPILQSKEVSSV